AFTGLVNVPMSDTFAVRASGYYRFDDGFIDSIGDTPIPSLSDPNLPAVAGTRVAENINALDSFGGRVSASFTPNDRFSLNLTALAQNIESDSSDLVDADPVTLEPLHPDPVRSQYHVDFADIAYRVYSAGL